MDKELRRAKNISFRLLKFRPRSEEEIAFRLKVKKIPAGTIKKAVSLLKQAGFLNDREFALSWIKSRIQAGYGFVRIEKELREKGVDRDLISESLGFLKEEADSLKIIEDLAKKRVKRYRNKSRLDIKRRLFQYLGGRGFFKEDILRVLEKLDYEDI